MSVKPESFSHGLLLGLPPRRRKRKQRDVNPDIPLPQHISAAYLSGVAVLGVGTPAGLIAVIALLVVSWKIVCASLVPK